MGFFFLFRFFFFLIENFGGESINSSAGVWRFLNLSGMVTGSMWETVRICPGGFRCGRAGGILPEETRGPCRRELVPNNGRASTGELLASSVTKGWIVLDAIFEANQRHGIPVVRQFDVSLHELRVLRCMQQTC